MSFFNNKKEELTSEAISVLIVLYLCAQINVRLYPRHKINVRINAGKALRLETFYGAHGIDLSNLRTAYTFYKRTIVYEERVDYC